MAELWLSAQSSRLLLGREPGPSKALKVRQLCAARNRRNCGALCVHLGRVRLRTAARILSLGGQARGSGSEAKGRPQSTGVPPQLLASPRNSLRLLATRAPRARLPSKRQLGQTKKERSKVDSSADSNSKPNSNSDSSSSSPSELAGSYELRNGRGCRATGAFAEVCAPLVRLSGRL